MGVHAIAIPAGLTAQPGASIIVDGEEAHHAVRVKRCAEGDSVDLCDGAGLRARGTIAAIERAHKGEWRVLVRVGADVRREPTPSPWLRVVGAAPKGDRLEHMIDALGQVGVSAWSPLRSERSVVDPRAHKLERLHRVSMETLKQCGRAWAMRIEEATEFRDAISGEPGAVVVLADATGEAFHTGLMPPRDAAPITLLIGPEGGFSEGELALARQRGALVARFGRHVMRIEVAAVVAAASVLGA